MIDDNFRSFVALEFENVCREWLLRQAQQNYLPFAPDQIGSHWSNQVQVDGVAINWRERQLLLAECKWGDRATSREVVTELIQAKTPKVLAELPDKGVGWTVHYALFSRHSFTPAARQEAGRHQTILRTLEQLEAELAD
jgi:hypothetical protein